MADKRTKTNNERAQKSNEGNQLYPEYNDREHQTKKTKNK